MFRPRVIQVIAVLIAAGLVYLSSGLTHGINEGRALLNLVGPESVLENTPPEYAFAIQAFGAFRGLITDIAFIRAESYKEQGRYYDAMQLARWICTLQPRFPSVWEFLSWNMAWNISVTTYTPEERWNWVYNGVKLLRDDALRFNPRAINLYKQLAWTFNNKMSESIDEFHQDYKRNWAWRMHLVLGPPPDPLTAYNPDQPFPRAEGFIGRDDPLLAAVIAEANRKEEVRWHTAQEDGIEYRPRDRSDAEQAIEAARAQRETDEGPTPYEVVKKARYDYIKAIDNAARSLEELYAQVPETREMVRQLRPLGVEISDDKSSEDDYLREEGLAITFFARYRRLTDTVSLLNRVARARTEDPAAEVMEEFDRIVGVRSQKPAGQALLRYLQRKVLSEVYKLDPAFMAYLTETFGPIDWRVVDAQSLYWVTQAIIMGKETLNTFRNDKTNTARIIFFSLRNLYLRNKVTFEPYTHDNPHRAYINLAPDPNFVEPLHQAFIIYGRMIDPDPGLRPGAGETFRSGHINFLTEAIRMLYFADRKREARKYYQYLRDTYYMNDLGEINEIFDKPLDQFVWDSYYESEGSIREISNVVNGLLMAGYNDLADGDYASYNNRVQMAFRLLETYMQDKWEKRGDRVKLPPFEQMRADALWGYLAGPPLNEQGTLRKARLWRVVPLNLRQAVYDDLAAGFRTECEWWDFDVEKAFPEPPDMDEYRKQLKPRGPEEEERGTETPAQPLG